jgi:predicted signal transduction protein with EAL and GGDEF domain
MSLAAALIYWLIVAIWLSVLATILVFYFRNARTFGTTRLLLAVIGIDTVRNIVENVYFGLYFGGQYGLFSSSLSTLLGIPYLLIIPKLINVTAGCLVLGLLLFRWLPSEIKERRKSDRDSEDLKQLSLQDGLTGLANRRSFDTYLSLQIAIAQRHKRSLALVMCDVDFFKAYNDQYGHQAGDDCLKQIATALESCCRRAADMAARYGGEEFAFVLPDTELTGFV